MAQEPPEMPMRWLTQLFSCTSSSSDFAILALSQSSRMKSLQIS